MAYGPEGPLHQRPGDPVAFGTVEVPGYVDPADQAVTDISQVLAEVGETGPAQPYSEAELREMLGEAA
jgi:hypothetical protein